MLHFTESVHIHIFIVDLHTIIYIHKLVCICVQINDKYCRVYRTSVASTTTLIIIHHLDFLEIVFRKNRPIFAGQEPEFWGVRCSRPFLGTAGRALHLHSRRGWGSSELSACRKPTWRRRCCGGRVGAFGAALCWSLIAFSSAFVRRWVRRFLPLSPWRRRSRWREYGVTGLEEWRYGGSI